MAKKNFRKFLKETKGYRLIAFLFLFSTVFFLLQHVSGLSWDFSSYVLNGKHFLSGEGYFEWLRAPLAPLMFSILSVFTWIAAEYIFIILISALHLFAILKLSKEAKINPVIFYALTLTPFFLNVSFIAGTELLSLALLELSIAFIISKKKSHLSGLFLGLSFLARYTSLIFLPLLLFNKKIKKIFLSSVFFIIPIIPWFVYNHAVTGNFLTSILSSYNLNISSRESMFIPFLWSHLLIVFNYYVFLFIPGIFKSKRNKIYWIMLLFLILSLFSYVRIPLKTQALSVKYLFTAVLPIAFFSTIFLEKIKKKNRKIIFAVFIILNLLLSVVFFINLPSDDLYKRAANFYDEECKVNSNIWVPLVYYGLDADAAYVDGNKEYIPIALNRGYRLFYFKSPLDEDYGYVANETFMEQFPIIKENEEFIILGHKDKCLKSDPSIHLDTSNTLLA
jgi:hypothetical protein